MTKEDWNSLLIHCGVKPITAAKWSIYFDEAVRPEAFSLGFDEVDNFVAQVLHESAKLECMEENLNYTTPEQICKTWPARFKTTDDALKYVRNPVALANKVYGGRFGNTEPGDGWKYRGSGPIGVTFKDNFDALEKITGLPLVKNPDMLRRPGVESLKVCIAWWEGHVPDGVMNNLVAVRKSVNGGVIGLQDTIDLTDKVKNELHA